MSLVRIQEFYESPKFKDKFFTLETFVDYWSNEFGHGVFDYPVKWSGFNFSGKTLLEWMFLFPYTNESYRGREREVVDRLMGRIAKDRGIKYPAVRCHPDYWGQLSYDNAKKCLSDVYIIAVNSEDGSSKKVVEHELAHALYALYPKYKLSCTNLLVKMDRTVDGKLIRGRSEDKLKDIGYGEDVFEDELQAYYSTGGSGSALPNIMEFNKNFNAFKRGLKKNAGKTKKMASKVRK